MKKTKLATQVAKMTIIVGTLTNWRCEYTQFAKKKSEIELFYFFNNDYSISDLITRLDCLIDALDCETSSVCVVLGEGIKVLS